MIYALMQSVKARMSKIKLFDLSAGKMTVIINNYY